MRPVALRMRRPLIDAPVSHDGVSRAKNTDDRILLVYPTCAQSVQLLREQRHERRDGNVFEDVRQKGETLPPGRSPNAGVALRAPATRERIGTTERVLLRSRALGDHRNLSQDLRVHDAVPNLLLARRNRGKERERGGDAPTYP